MSARGGQARDLARALGVAALGLAGALPGSRGAPDPCALLVWFALVAPAAGALAGGLRLRAWPHAAAVPGAWAFLLVFVDAASERDLPDPQWLLAATAGLFAAGFAAGRRAPAQARWRSAAVALALAAAATLLPLAGFVLRAPWPSAVTARLLDLSPATLLAECAGLDWLRHPAVYDPAGSVDLDPAARAPYTPALAGGIVFVVGCALAVAVERRARGRETDARATHAA